MYIGTNNFDATDVYQGASLFVIPRSDLFAAVPSVSSMSMFSSLVVDPVPLFTFQGAVNWQATPGNSANILAITSGWGNVMRMQALGVNASGATFTPASLVINLPSAVEIQPARQPDGTRLVDPLDDRISANVVQVNGKLYGVQTITLNTADYAQLHWFVLNASTGALIEDGFIGGDDYDYYQGSIAVNEWGNAVIGYNRSGGPEKGNDGRISFMAQAFRTDGLGGLDAFGTSVLLKRSEIDNYHCGPESPIDPNCRQRWGDYAAVTLDPLDHQRFWAIGEYAEGWQVLPNSPITDPRANWSTYIAALELEPAPVPLPILGVGGSFLWRRRLRRRIAVGTAGQRSSG